MPGAHRGAKPRSRLHARLRAGQHREMENTTMTQGMASTNLGNIPDEQVQLRLRGLQHEVERSATFARRLGWLAIGLIALLIVLMISIYLYSVMQYASVNSVSAAAIEGRPGVAEIEYVPGSSGKIDFVRESDGLVQILSEHAVAPSAGDSKRKFTWSGKKGETSSLHVTYRSGLFLVTKELPLARISSKE